MSEKIGYDVREYMLKEEQNFQCAYTEIHIDPENSHVDHFRKQSLFPKSVFEWNNLLASCNNEYYGAKFKDNNIKRKEDYQCLVNPVKEDPRRYFKYSITGDMLANEENGKGQFTIDSFNLNDYALVEQRKIVASHVKAMCKQFSLEEVIVLIGSFESFIRAIYADLKNIEDSIKD
ncbi:retron system putative HNH endonuclease [Desulfobacterales bacterium HSG2]|nr:retron system putative HNH endonuclease [Desulfobacterales bacterium HSG2]